MVSMMSFRTTIEYATHTLVKIWQHASHILLLTPVLVSFSILQLSWREAYWRNPSAGGIPEILGVLQVAAKAHELLIIYSLSQVLIYHIRAQLSSTNGLPFGLFTTGFAATLGQPPYSPGFWWCCFSVVWRRRIRWRHLAFAGLVLLVTLVCLTAGPASAIVLIPQLQWWHKGDLFYFAQGGKGFDCNPNLRTDPLHSDYSLYIPKQLFPDEVSQNTLPGAFCVNASLDVNALCPLPCLTNGLAGLNWTGINNFTVPTENNLGIEVGRTVATFTNSLNDLIDDNRTALLPPHNNGWTTNQLITNFLSQGAVAEWQQGRPTMTIEARHGLRRGMLSPYTNVACEVRPSTTFSRNLTFLVDSSYLLTQREYLDSEGSYVENELDGHRYLNGTYDVRNIWAEETLKDPPHTLFEWREFQTTNNVWILAGFILSTNKGQDIANVSMCSVLASFEQDALAIIPTTASQSNKVLSDTMSGYSGSSSTIDILLAVSHPYGMTAVRKSWADALNKANGTSNTTVMTQFLDAGMKQYVANVDPTDKYFPSFGHSLMLSIAVANGLSAIGLEYQHNVTMCRKGWCSQGPFYSRSQEFVVANSTNEHDNLACGDMGSPMPGSNEGNRSRLLHTFAEPDEAFRNAQWTQLSFPVFKYGYGWGFDSITVKVATAILLFHAMMILTHIVLSLYFGGSESYANGLAELLALALQSSPSLALEPVAMAPGRKTWNKAAMVRRRKQLEPQDDQWELALCDVPHRKTETW
ncbi:uncharacterized protein KY384_001748 [Bacidia gigantensis]|uniref:uncharacterized protein n=1 Tax=Bacidia gigantensis TaxID=2732470 RepID=UPI001D045078|nr:uncharacterized protein KY384_001748 [Bacidia gigantensis]KAG8532966.1 hypothetical protein KY384_001748 [Bacidia gigantensis]